MSARLWVRHPEGTREHPVEDLSELRDRLAWLDIEGRDIADLGLLTAELDLHALAVEDAQQRDQRPKLDLYKEHALVVAYAAEAHGEGVALRELTIFVTRQAVVTVRDARIGALTRVERAFENGDFGTPGRLVHALIDACVDSFGPVEDALDARLGRLERQMLQRAGREQAVTTLLDLKETLLDVRQRLSPQRDVLAQLARGECALVESELGPYFRDTLDHASRSIDEAQRLRERAADLTEAHLMMTSNALAVAMQRLTAFASVLLGVSLVTGFFGMNFTAIPFDRPALFVAALGLMLLTAGTLALYFRRRRWL